MRLIREKTYLKKASFDEKQLIANWCSATKKSLNCSWQPKPKGKFDIEVRWTQQATWFRWQWEPEQGNNRYIRGKIVKFWIKEEPNHRPISLLWSVAIFFILFSLFFLRCHKENLYNDQQLLKLSFPLFSCDSEVTL